MQHQARLAEFSALVAEEQFDLARASLLVAAARYPGWEPSAELAKLDGLAKGAASLVRAGDEPIAQLNALSQYLFDEIGLRGNQDEYYDPRNSYLHLVLQRRLGIPITLSLIYIETGRRLGVPLVGIGMPGHFLVRHRDVPDLFVDCFHKGILLSMEECETRFRQVVGEGADWSPAWLAPLPNRDFLARMLRNLKGIYLQRNAYAEAIETLDFLVALLPGSPDERRDRGLAHYRAGQYAAAKADLEAYLAAVPAGPDATRVRGLIEQATQRLQSV